MATIVSFIKKSGFNTSHIELFGLDVKLTMMFGAGDLRPNNQ